MVVHITEIKTSEGLERCYPVLKELREELSFQDFISTYEAAKQHDGYTFVGAFEGSQCIAVMGYRILFDYVHGKHLYIDDLVTTASHRSKGIGARFLAYAEERAKEQRCKGLRLCTGVDRKDSQRFYENNGWNARALAYKKQLT